jgi:hypothetical protein
MTDSKESLDCGGVSASMEGRNLTTSSFYSSLYKTVLSQVPIPIIITFNLMEKLTFINFKQIPHQKCLLSIKQGVTIF